MVMDQIETDFITLTPAAAKAVQDLLDSKNLNGYALRVFVSGSGCSGLQYGMALENNIRDLDIIAEMHGVKVVVDEVSIEYMRGSNVDYITEATVTGFKITNPNAAPSCGCGSSSQSSDATEGGCGGGSCGCN